MTTRPAVSAYPVLALLGLLVLVPVASLVALGSFGADAAGLEFWQSHYLRRVVFFSLWQALLSSLLSVGLALLVARALFMSGDFALRRLLLRLFGLPLVVPSVVAVMGLVSVYGSNGWLPLGSALYGINGILLAHVFFNLPLAVRLLLPVWQAIPRQQWQLAEQLGFSSWQSWRHCAWPALRESLPGVGILVFMLCLTSFAVVLTLGGGPRSTTLEVAIYQSLRFDFDPPRAVILALLQLILCALVAWVSLRLHRLPEVEISLASGQPPVQARPGWFNRLVIFAAAVFVGLPLLAMLIDAGKGPVWRVLAQPGLWQSAAFTLVIGLSAAGLALLGGWLLLRTSSDFALLGARRRASLIEFAGAIVYLVPPLVIGTGTFVLIAPWVNVFDWAIPIVILINAMMGLPFVIRCLGPAMRQNKMRYQRLAESLALQGWNRFILLDWPLLRKPAALSAALVAALAMGDLGVIALFGTPDTATLPLMLYQQLAAYQMPQAAVTAVFLLLLCLSIFWLLETLIGGPGRAQH